MGKKEKCSMKIRLGVEGRGKKAYHCRCSTRSEGRNEAVIAVGEGRGGIGYLWYILKKG